MKGVNIKMVEIGEYVKFENGTIFIVTPGLKTFINEHESRSEKDLVEFLGRIKHSKQLIDLIRVGDIVNGYRVKAVYLEGATKYIKLDNAYENGQGIRTYEENIETILTKEQLEANCYKVGGE